MIKIRKKLNKKVTLLRQSNLILIFSKLKTFSRLVAKMQIENEKKHIDQYSVTD